jgi:predicted DNA-binding transcriptional regulator AlpA
MNKRTEKGDRSTMTTGLEPLWKIAEVSAYLGVPVKTLYQWRYLGTGPKAARIGRGLRYDPEDVRAWFRQQRDEAA